MGFSGSSIIRGLVALGLVGSFSTPLSAESGLEERLRATIEFMSSTGSRISGYPGSEAAADHIEAAFVRLGVDQVKREAFDVTVPIDQGGSLEVTSSGARYTLSCLWPNLVRTPTLPARGVDAPMVYVGKGEYAEFKGKEIAGRIVLMEFNSWTHWIRLASLGARGVVFIAPEETSWRQAEDKTVFTPLDMPRFWVERAEGLQLKSLVEAGEVQVHLQARMDWHRRQAYNIWGVIPGTDPELAGETIAVQAYYDGTSVVPAIAPSAEAAASIAGLLELARHLEVNPPKRTIVLVATAAHFLGQRGIAHFLHRHARTHPKLSKEIEDPIDLKLFISLDLSTQTNQVGIWNNTYSYDLKRFFVPFGRRFTKYAIEASPGADPEGVLANGISPIKGMDWSTFVPGGLSIDSEVALDAGLVSLAFATIHDARFIIDTPTDTPDRVNAANLATQIELINGMFQRGFNDPELFADLEDFGPVLKDNRRPMRLKVRAYPRRSQTPDFPVKNSIAALDWGYHKGVRQVQYYLSDDEGGIHAPFQKLGGMLVRAFVVDPESGEVTYATDLSKRAENVHGKPNGDGEIGQAIRWNTNNKVVVVFPCLSSPFYGLVDPYLLGALRGPKIIDANGIPPRQFGFLLAGEEDKPVGVVFTPPESADEKGIKIIMGQRLLLLNNKDGAQDESEARGVGYTLSQDALVPTELLAVRDMWRLNEARLQTMRRHAIENQWISFLHQQGAEYIDKAEEKRAEKDWEGYVRNVRAALGVNSRAYPQVLATLNDVISGMVFFLALLIPAAFFAERLIYGAPDIRAQLAVFGVILAVIWAVLSQIHPAFAIAHPLIILLGFSIMAMAAFVMAMVSTRFNTFMKDHRARAAQIHEVDISRISAAYAAFMLGISNMRRRVLRTSLTLITLTLLTFTVLSFTSFNPSVRFMAFSVPQKGAYEGVLVRNRGWDSLGETTLDYTQSHFSKSGLISPRNWYIALDEEQKKYIEIHRGDRVVRSTGLLGVAPQEAQITGLDQALAAGSFFERDDEASCLLPEPMATALDIRAADVGKVRVQIFGKPLLVRGILDAERFEEIRDLDDETLTPADFQMSSTQALGPETQVQMSIEVEDISEVRPFVHLEVENVAVLPFSTLREAGGDLRSVAVRFDPEVNGRGLVEEFLTRLAITLFAGLRDEGEEDIDVYSYTSVGMTSVEGLGALVIPMFIAALIVLNTMLGAVYERFREISIYSSVGLAPMHIALLFIAEACVYAVIGVTLGYILGQGLGKVLIHLDLLAGMNLNYSSMSAIFSALLVMAVVLLSTIYPARMAARSAVPDTVRRWTPPDPEGDKWIFEFPFMVSEAEVLGLCGFLSSYFNAYSEESIGTFYADKVRVAAQDEEGGRTYAVQLLQWLAPFDMGVSQYLQLECVPATLPGAYTIVVYIERISGQDTFWQRVNRRFFNGLRKEFLIWHTLSAADKQMHRQTAEAMLVILDSEAEVAGG